MILFFLFLSLFSSHVKSQSQACCGPSQCDLEKIALSSELLSLAYNIQNSIILSKDCKIPTNNDSMFSTTTYVPSTTTEEQTTEIPTTMSTTSEPTTVPTTVVTSTFPTTTRSTTRSTTTTQSPIYYWLTYRSVSNTPYNQVEARDECATLGRIPLTFNTTGVWDSMFMWLSRPSGYVVKLTWTSGTLQDGVWRWWDGSEVNQTISPIKSFPGDDTDPTRTSLIHFFEGYTNVTYLRRVSASARNVTYYSTYYKAERTSSIEGGCIYNSRPWSSDTTVKDSCDFNVPNFSRFWGNFESKVGSSLDGSVCTRKGRSVLYYDPEYINEVIDYIREFGFNSSAPSREGYEYYWFGVHKTAGVWRSGGNELDADFVAQIIVPAGQEASTTLLLRYDPRGSGSVAYFQYNMARRDFYEGPTNTGNSTPIRMICQVYR